nr:hypothetical protein [Tanacetum cinerariifolium]
MDQNIDFSGSDQIQTLQYPEIHPTSQEISDEVFQANHSAQHKEYPENSSNEIAVSNSNQEKEALPQDSDIRQLIREECGIEVCEEQKQKIEDTILELVKICCQKSFFEVKNVVEQPAERKTRIVESLQNFRVIRKSSTSLKNTPQISLVHAIAPILSTEEPEHSFSMGYEHFSTTLVTEFDEVAESSIKNLVPIPCKCEVTSEDESKCDMPIQDQSSSVFTTFSNPLFEDNDDLTSSDDELLSEEDVPVKESKVYSNSLFNVDETNSDELESHVESNFVESLSNHNALIESSQKIDYPEEFLSELAHINPEITESNFDFEEEIHFIENLLEEIDIVTKTDDMLPSSVENDDDSEGEIDAVEELHVDNSISNVENKLSANEESDFDNPSFPRPLLEPLDAKFDFELDEEISVVMNDIGDEFDVSNNENDDFCSFMFVIRIFMPYLICSKMILSFLPAESEDTIFDPGISVLSRCLDHFVEIPSGEIKVHIEVLSVLWGNRLPIRTVHCRCLGKDCAQNVKNQSKPDNIGHKIGSLQQKLDQQAVFHNNQAKKPKMSKNQSSGINLANCSKFKSRKSQIKSFKG